MMHTSVTPELLPLTDTLLLLLPVKSHRPKLQSEAGLSFFHGLFIVGVLVWSSHVTCLPQGEGDHRCVRVKSWKQVLGFNKGGKVEELASCILWFDHPLYQEEDLS